MEIDYPVANSYFQKISSIVGEEKMEDFNNVMAEAFVFEGGWIIGCTALCGACGGNVPLS